MVLPSPVVNILWPQLIVALLLLWIPRQWLRAGGALFKRRRKSNRARRDREAEREPGDNTIYFRDEFLKVRNYVDFFRAGIGGLAIVGLSALDVAPALQAGDDASDWRVALIRYAGVLIMLVGVLIQSFRFETRSAMFPPIFYISGLTFGTCGVTVAALAVVLTWVLNTTLSGPVAFLTLYAVLVGIFGAFLLDDLQQVGISAALVFTPVMISLLAKKRLVHFSKKVKVGGQAAG